MVGVFPCNRNDELVLLDEKDEQFIGKALVDGLGLDVQISRKGLVTESPYRIRLVSKKMQGGPAPLPSEKKDWVKSLLFSRFDSLEDVTFIEDELPEILHVDLMEIIPEDEFDN